MAEDIPTTPPVPQIAKKRRGTTIAIAIGATILLLTILVIGGVVLLHNSSEPEQAPPEEVATPITQNEDNASQAAPTASPLFSPQASSSPSAESNRERLAVTVEYQRNPQFTLSIGEVSATPFKSTSDSYRPTGNEPFSIIRIFDGSGNVIVEDTFTVSTEVELETPEGLVVAPLEESSVFVVIDIPGNVQPKRVQIVSEQQTVLDEADISFELAATESPTILSRIKNWFTARAQGAGVFTIVVMNSQNGTISDLLVAKAATDGIFAVEPWTTFRPQTQIIQVFNTEDLGCTSITLGTGFPYPVCADSGRIYRAIASQAPGVQPDAVVVATNFLCQCGTVVTLPITAVGSSATTELVVHEFGHAVGDMVDEYFYQTGATTGRLEPNCFPSESSCRAAVDQLPGASCSQGCRTVDSWRPATNIMHNTYSPFIFGPLEECIMYNSIANVIGVPERSCEGVAEDGFYDQVF